VYATKEGAKILESFLNEMTNETRLNLLRVIQDDSKFYEG
jgi:hypothetical protein